MIGYLGKGKFGTVYEVKERKSNKRLALKIISKDDIKRMNMIT